MRQRWASLYCGQVRFEYTQSGWTEKSGPTWVQTGKSYYPFGGAYGTALVLDGDLALIGATQITTTGAVVELSLSGSCPQAVVADEHVTPTPTRSGGAGFRTATRHP